MAVNRDSNGYTFGFAITLVVIVGALLAGVAMWTKPYKQKNDNVKKQIDILKALLPADEADKVSRKNAQDLFQQYVDLDNAIVLDINGKVKEGVDAFNVDIKKEYRDKELALEDKNFPLYVAEYEGEKAYVIPIVGKGLWGPIWGNICLASDMRTIQGVSFDHKGETPGLGAEIKQSFFKNRWIGETVSDDNGDFTKFTVVKDNSGNGPNNKIDGITGGTITSKGVEEMANRCLQVYVKYFKSLKNS